MKYTGETYNGETIRLDSNEFEGCTFINCKFVFEGGQTSIHGCTIDAIHITFQGAAGSTLNLMRVIYRAAGSMKKI